MYDLGTPLSTLGWALPSFQAKNQDVVVPLSVHTMHKRHMLFLHTPKILLENSGWAHP